MNPFKNLFNRIFNRGGAAEGSGGIRGWFKERRQQRQYERSQRRQDRMDRAEEKRRESEKAKRAAEDRAKKEADARKQQQRYKESEKKFNKRWGFTPEMHDNFLQFINSIPPDVREAFGSEQLVEIYRSGHNLDIKPEDLSSLVLSTWNNSEAITADELVDEVYTNMQMLRQFQEEE